MAGTPSLVKTADPYSTLVLSPLMMEVFRLQVILPAYPVGQERETVLQTGKSLCLVWQQQIL
jgi:hypothetical protein